MYCFENTSGGELGGDGLLAGGELARARLHGVRAAARDDDDIVAIADEVEWSSLKELQLAANGFGYRGAEALLNNLAASCVDVLDLRQNKLTRGIFPAVTRAYAQRSLPSLRVCFSVGLQWVVLLRLRRYAM